MDNKSNVHCPQCLHQNSKKALKCSLCDWVLKQGQLNETLVCDEGNLNDDPDRTIAPRSDNQKYNESIETHVPNQKAFNSGRSITEKQTFHLAGDLAHFEIHEILGQGGMGAVYHAKDKTLHRDVAIKMLRPMLASSQINTESLLDEARMASKLNHTNIVTIYDVARNKDSNYIIMEWVEGQALDELIPNEGLAAEKALEYACQIADGLTSAHQKHIIHRDIKPQNIMLNQQNTIKILDFGIAGLMNQKNKSKIKTNDESIGTRNSNSKNDFNNITGTPSYMSPEQAQGLNLDQRSDIFSFGTVLYQMLCGKRPFVGNNFKQVKEAICTGNYTSIQQHKPELSTDIVQLVEKMLATQKDRRWQSSVELAAALHAIYDELTYKKNWWQRRNWLSKAAIILPFVLALGWSSKEILFPASTQHLIERQLHEATKIAILPFDNISGDPFLQLFSDGLAVNLGSDLSAIAAHQGNTWIVPSTEISRMKDQSPKKVVDKYGVNLILTGSIQHMGSTRLLVLNLLNGTDGQLLKTTEISIDADNLFLGHGKIRKQALALLGWKVPDALITKFKADRPTLDGAYKEYLLGIGYLYRFDQAGNYEKAIKSFAHAIDIDPKYQRAIIGEIETYRRQYNETKAQKWILLMSQNISKLKKLNQHHPILNYYTAVMYLKKGQYKKAAESYEKSIINNPNHLESFFGLAETYEVLKEYDKTDEIYNGLKQSSPNNVLRIINLGVIYFRRGDYNRAIKQFEILAKTTPNNHWAYLNMAAGYYLLSQIDKAIYYTEIAIKLKPTDDSYSNLGTMYFYKGDYEKAVTAYEKMIDINSTDYINWGNLADAYHFSKNEKAKGAYQHATKLAQSALDINPKNTMAISLNSYYLAYLNKRQESLYFAQKIGQAQTGLENYVVATTYAFLEELNLAFNHLNIALDKNYPLEEIQNSPLLNSIKKDKRFILLKNSE